LFFFFLFSSFLFFFFFIFRWHYSPLWALACRTIPLHFSLSITNSLHLLTPSTWGPLNRQNHKIHSELITECPPSLIAVG
jgi:hypothetical protein